MLYIDTSSLLKLLLPEPESARVQEAVAAEVAVVVSSLAELEAETQLRAGFLGGHLTRRQHRCVLDCLAGFRQQEPFTFRSLPGTLFQTALRQHRAAERPHLRLVDRLHLAAMEELQVRRLMTHDAAQAEAARGMGYEVTSPR